MALNSDAVVVSLGTTPICGINNIAFDPVLDQLDTTNFCSAGAREFLAGLHSATMKFDGDYTPSDAGQVKLINAWKNKTKLVTTDKPKFMVDAVNGFTADGYVSGMSVSVGIGGKVSVSYTLQLTGAIGLVP